MALDMDQTISMAAATATVPMLPPPPPPPMFAENVLPSSSVLITVDDLPVPAPEGKRCSTRNLGKKRPYYGYEKPDAKPAPAPKLKKMKQAVRKRAQITDGTLGPGVPLLTRREEESSKGKGETLSTEASVGDGFVECKQNGESQTLGADFNDGVGGISEQEAGGKSAHLRVKETLRLFNTHMLQFVQEEEQRYREVEAMVGPKKTVKTKPKNKKGKKLKDNKLPDPEVPPSEEAYVVSVGGEVVKRASKRPDLKAITEMINTNTVLYPEKRIGHLPGIDVGQQFFSRAEMVVLGLHSHWLNGIDYMGVSYGKMEQYKGYKFPLAVCIVLSGMYEDDLDNAEDVIYTGQGGHDLLGRKLQIADQKMERGNLALKNCWEFKVPVRVVRGHTSLNSYCGKVYTYDGLYQVQKYWVEKGVAGFTVYKYRLKRVDGQPPLTTNQVFFTRSRAPQLISELRGLVCEDISGGQEKFKIPATNVVDDPPFPPTDFVYYKSLQVATGLELPAISGGCQCKGDCVDPRICACAKLNGSDFPYVRRDGGRLVEAKAVVFECGPKCGCNEKCVNRTSQQGLKFQFEVFRTPKKGWAVRSWDTIPSGSPICEYTGILTKTDEIESTPDNSYIFDIDCLQTMKGLDGRERRPGDVSMLTNFDDKKAEVPEYCIDAGSCGNIARFINHSCQPNLFVQCVLSSHHDIKMARVMLFAADTIPPLQELTYDYGYVLGSVVGPDGTVKRLDCYCGAADCRKRLY